MDPLSTAITVVTSLLGGAVGGVLTVGTITRLTERSHERYDDKRKIHDRVRSYLASIKYDEAMLPRRSSFPADYASLKGQYALCFGVLQDSVRLSNGDRRKLRSNLLLLVGQTTLTGCERLVDVPDGKIDAQQANADRALDERVAVQHPTDHDQAAYLRRLVTNHLDTVGRELAGATLEEMIKLTKP